MIFAESDGRYARVHMHHRFAGHMTLGAEIAPVATRTPTRQLMPTQLEPLPPAPYAPTRTSSLITVPDGDYREARAPAAVPNAYAPVRLPTAPVNVPSVPRDPAPIPGVYPTPTLPHPTKPPSTSLPPERVSLPPEYVAPDDSSGGYVLPPPVSPFVPGVIKAPASNVKWAVIGGLGVLGILGLVLILKP